METGIFSLFVLLQATSVIGLALFVYKKFNLTSFASKNSKTLSVEESLNLSARKTLYIVNANGEKFLIAGDMERTTLISKLGDNKPIEKKQTVDLSEFIEKEDELLKKENPAVMKNLVKKLERGIR